MFFGGDRRGFVRISDGGIAARRVRQDFRRWNCCEGVVNWKVEIIFFFYTCVCDKWQNETCNFFVFLASELEDVSDERFVNVEIILEAERTPVRLLKQGRMKFQISNKNVLPSLLPVMSRTGKIGCLKTKLP